MTKEKIRHYYRLFMLFFAGVLVGGWLSYVFGDWDTKYHLVVLGIFFGVALVAWLTELYVGRAANKGTR
jgi:uncharacterized membrane protein YiaA